MADKKHSEEITRRFLQAARTCVANRVNDITTQTEFALMVGEYNQNISRMENGTRYPTIETLALTCEVFGIDANWLLLGVGDMKPGDETKRRLDLIEKQLQALTKKKPVKKRA